MTRCSVCARSDAGAIDALLAEGRSARSVAGEYGLSARAVQRHATHHGGRTMPAVPESVPESASDPLDELTAALRVRALAGDAATAREYRLALAAQAAVRHAARPIHDLAAAPEWLTLRSAILGALEPYPEARQAVADALEPT